MFIYAIDAHSTKDFIVDINANDITKESKIVFQIVRTDRNPADIIRFNKNQHP